MWLQTELTEAWQAASAQGWGRAMDALQPRLQQLQVAAGELQAQYNSKQERCRCGWLPRLSMPRVTRKKLTWELRIWPMNILRGTGPCSAHTHAVVHGPGICPEHVTAPSSLAAGLHVDQSPAENAGCPQFLSAIESFSFLIFIPLARTQQWHRTEHDALCHALAGN